MILPVFLPLCQYCVTPKSGAYFRPMYKQIIIILGLIASLAGAQTPYEPPAAKQAMIRDIQEWVGLNTNLQPSQVDVTALDRRLKVPLCDSPFTVSFPYKKSQKTVKVSCPASGWSAYIGIRLADTTAAFSYIKSLSAGDAVTEASVKLIKVSSSTRGLVMTLDKLKGKRLTTDVSAGQVVKEAQLGNSVVVFKLKADILKGGSVGIDDVQAIVQTTTITGAKNLFPKAVLEHATAARDLRESTILSRSDLNIRHLILMTTKAVTRGQKLGATNVGVRPFYGNLPADALYSASDVVQMESIRTLRSGQPLRASDIRPSLMVKKGDSIVLRSGSGFLSITTTMIALENGKLDQQINLLSPESNETVRGVITGPGRARSLKSKKY
tara:strand:- start:17318 stop:18466 length:1149 start_codon:yes stop_codon:yes gene_type:complete